MGVKVNAISGNVTLNTTEILKKKTFFKFAQSGGGGQSWIFLASCLFSLNRSALDYSASAPPLNPKIIIFIVLSEELLKSFFSIYIYVSLYSDTKIVTKRVIHNLQF